MMVVFFVTLNARVRAADGALYNTHSRVKCEQVTPQMNDFSAGAVQPHPRPCEPLDRRVLVSPGVYQSASFDDLFSRRVARMNTAPNPPANLQFFSPPEKNAQEMFGEIPFKSKCLTDCSINTFQLLLLEPLPKCGPWCR